MYLDGEVRISRVQNGYVVQTRDPAIVAANRKRDAKSMANRNASVAPYQDPDKQYVFSTIDELNTFLKANLDKALAKPEFDDTFDALTGDD